MKLSLRRIHLDLRKLLKFKESKSHSNDHCDSKMHLHNIILKLKTYMYLVRWGCSYLFIFWSIMSFVWITVVKILHDMQRFLFYISLFLSHIKCSFFVPFKMVFVWIDWKRCLFFKYCLLIVILITLQFFSISVRNSQKMCVWFLRSW